MADTNQYPNEKRALRAITLACPNADQELREELAYLVSVRRRTLAEAIAYIGKQENEEKEKQAAEEEKRKEKERLQEKMKKQEEERRASLAAVSSASSPKASSANGKARAVSGDKEAAVVDIPEFESEGGPKLKSYFYGDNADNFEEEIIGEGGQVILFTTSMTGDVFVRTQCSQIETLLYLKKIPYHYIDVADNPPLQRKAKQFYMRTTKKQKMPAMPFICVDNNYIGNYPECQEMEDFGELDDRLEKFGFITKERQARVTAEMIRQEEERKAKEEEERRAAEEEQKRIAEEKLEARIRELEAMGAAKEPENPEGEGEAKEAEKNKEDKPAEDKKESEAEKTEKKKKEAEEAEKQKKEENAKKEGEKKGKKEDEIKPLKGFKPMPLSTSEEGASYIGSPNYPSAAAVVANAMKKRQALMTYSEYKSSANASKLNHSGSKPSKISTLELLELSRSNANASGNTPIKTNSKDSGSGDHKSSTFENPLKHGEKLSATPPPIKTRSHTYDPSTPTAGAAAKKEKDSDVVSLPSPSAHKTASRKVSIDATKVLPQVKTDTSRRTSASSTTAGVKAH